MMPSGTCPQPAPGLSGGTRVAPSEFLPRKATPREDCMRVRWGVIVTIPIIIVGGFAVIFSGVFNVAATYEDNAVVAWVLHKTFVRSVQSRASTPQPGPFTDTQVKAGAHLYNETCVYCHGG